ncbi:MAG: hypothetical protein KF752_10955 [Pirellulaceae bacterium]|nr:hypothetical protein [Pirellulaceae bacterium]
MSTNVNDKIHPLFELLQQDHRYHIEAYQFVREALAYAQEVLQMPPSGAAKEDGEGEHHINGQQLCEAIRQYALSQFGYMAKTVLNSWGIYTTGDFGEIVYNLIRIKHMKKSSHDRREDFDNAYDFATAFDPVFELAENDD